MNYAAEWNAEHAKREMMAGAPLRPTEDFFRPFKNVDNPLSVLDIGCGAGTNAIWLAREGFKVWAFDSSPAAIGRLIETALGLKVNRWLTPTIVDATQHWPYRDAAFDIAFEIRVLENLTVDEAKFAYKQIARVLKPNGLFYCLTASQARPDKYTTVGITRPTTDLELGEWLSDVGLKINRISREYQGTLEDWNVVAKRV